MTDRNTSIPSVGKLMGRRRRNLPEHVTPTAGAVLENGDLVELVYRPEEKETCLVVGQGDTWREEESVLNGPRHRLIPYSATNTLLVHDVVRFPSGVEEYGSTKALVREVRDFIHRYVDVSPLFEEIASYYVLFTWIYDAFNELPYLRVRGDFGTGKSRFLLTVGSLCYTPIFASGASSVSPLFRMLHAFRGTLIMDESDFRMSDERAEVVKILNNGNARGFPVLRSEATGKQGKEYEPRAYAVFGPKIVATRGYFQDRALESRFLTEELGGRRLREDIPLNLGPEHAQEALLLRNKLLLFRLRNRSKPRDVAESADRTIEPRLSQIFAPLLSTIEDTTARAALRDLARRYHGELVADRGMDREAQVLAVIRDLTTNSTGPVSVKDVADLFIDRHAEDFQRKVTPRWVGSVIRRKLGLRPYKTGGVFVVPQGELLERLYEKYGIGESDNVDEKGTAVDIGT